MRWDLVPWQCEPVKTSGAAPAWKIQEDILCQSNVVPVWSVARDYFCFLVFFHINKLQLNKKKKKDKEKNPSNFL